MCGRQTGACPGTGPQRGHMQPASGRDGRLARCTAKDGDEGDRTHAWTVVASLPSCRESAASRTAAWVYWEQVRNLQRQTWVGSQGENRHYQRSRRQALNAGLAAPLGSVISHTALGRQPACMKRASRPFEVRPQQVSAQESRTCGVRPVRGVLKNARSRSDSWRPSGPGAPRAKHGVGHDADERGQRQRRAECTPLFQRKEPPTSPSRRSASEACNKTSGTKKTGW